MRHILRQRDWIADPWRYLGEPDAGTPQHPDVIVPLAQLRGDPGHWAAPPGGRLGAALAVTDAPEALSDLLPRLALVAVEFPNPGDGRGYSQGRILRARLGFRGELRAAGKGVRLDQVFLLARCGFDVLELADGVDVEAARRALGRYRVAYQPGDPQVRLERQRFFA
ncbi:MAG: DUF934 domain-containing protein [Proteobacteria bacterium]|nr:DUF934 domain-containing protein [Pseudomonadota bacterium]